MKAVEVSVERRKPNIVCFDLETTNLNANFGYLLAVGHKRLGDKKASCFSITDFPQFKKDPTNDYWLVKEASKVLAEADVLVGWYSSRFDLPYFQSRLLFHKLPILPPIPHVDGWRIARYKMKLNSNRLASVTAFLGLEEKTPLSGPIWVKAAAGHQPSIKYIVEHCLQDVEVLEQVYERIKPLMPNHPSVSILTENPFACPTCGSEKTQRRGFHVTRMSKYQRYQCRDCGAWSHDGFRLAKALLH